MTADPFIALIDGLALVHNYQWNVQPPDDCEMATKYSAILFIDLVEYTIEYYVIKTIKHCFCALTLAVEMLKASGFTFSF